MSGSICRDCRRSFTPIRHPLCPSCGQPFAAGPDHLCHRCEQQLPPFDLARAGGFYRGALLKAVQKLKYQGRSHLARDLGIWLARCWEEYHSEYRPDLVIPVPLHPRRIRERRFNQALLLAQEVSSHLGIPCDPYTLVRLRDTPPQVGLSETERRKNVREAFGFAPGRERVLAGRRVLMIDDVMTTGATTRECAKILKRSGAEKVFALLLARAE